MRIRLVPGAFIPALIFASAGAWAQSPAIPNTLAGRAQQAAPAPTFRARTELVQVSVIAQDKQGKPVADLRREEFQLFDNGAPQEIRLFTSETEKSNLAAPEVKAANTFTNRIAPPAGSHSGYSVILIDSLFTDADTIEAEGTSTLAKDRTLHMLRSIPTGEKIAIYAQERKLRVICEFTTDRDLLERQLRRWYPKIDTPGTTLRVFHEPGYRNPQNVRLSGNEAGGAELIDRLQRASAGDFEMGLVADHLAGIPGRKNLIWLTDKFAIGPRAIRKLNAAGVSIYPVDVDGVCGHCARPLGSPETIAALTGGVAYTRRNDLDIAMREAMDDGRVSYMLGFYPSVDDDSASQGYQLTVSVSRKGVTLRYRTGYEAEPVRPVSADPAADLVQALNRPIDATAIPIKASVTRSQDRLDLEAVLSLESLDLVQDNNLWTGKIEVVARFTTADGIIASDVYSKTVTLNLTQASYDAAVRGGLPFHNVFEIPSKAVEMKLLFGNPASGKIGTLTIPLSKVAASR
jgi:VWFA-related protein